MVGHLLLTGSASKECTGKAFAATLI